MLQSTSATFSRVERAGPGERHARSDRPPPSIGWRTGRILAHLARWTSTTSSAASSRSSSPRCGTTRSRCAWNWPGSAAASQLRRAPASATIAASGWLVSCAIDAASSPSVVDVRQGAATLVLRSRRPPAPAARTERSSPGPHSAPPRAYRRDSRQSSVRSPAPCPVPAAWS